MKIWQKEKLGLGHINRPGYTGATKSRYRRLCSKTHWFQDKALQPRDQNEPESPGRTGKNPKKKRRQPKFTEGVLFIPYTPGGALKKELQEMDQKLSTKKFSGKTKFVENLGRTMDQTLCNP